MGGSLPPCLAWDGKYHWADLSGLFKRLQSICSYFTSSTCHNQGLDLWVNLQQCLNKQTPVLTGKVSLGEFQPAREQAEVVSIAPDSVICWYKWHQRRLHPVLGQGPARSWALWGSASVVCCDGRGRTQEVQPLVRCVGCCCSVLEVLSLQLNVTGSRVHTNVFTEQIKVGEKKKEEPQSGFGCFLSGKAEKFLSICN